MDWPVFQGTEKQKTRQIIDWLYQNIKSKAWTKAHLDSRYFSRSPEQIVREGHAYYMLPCTDVGSVAAELLLANGFSPSLVLDKHSRKGRAGAHFTVEFTIDSEPVHLKINRAKIQVVKGFLKKTSETPKILRVPLQHSRASTPYWELFGIRNLTELRRVLNTPNLPLFERSFHAVPGKGKRVRELLRRTRHRIWRRIKRP